MKYYLMEYDVQIGWGGVYQPTYVTYRHDERNDFLTTWENKRNATHISGLKVYFIDTAQKTCTGITDQFQEIKNAI